jgi:hypothetical protein
VTVKRGEPDIDALFEADRPDHPEPIVPFRDHPTWQALPDELRSPPLSIYRSALQRVSAIEWTARGTVTSASPGKLAIIRRRGRPLFAARDPHAQWWDELRPYGVRDRDLFGPGTSIEAAAA